MRKERIVSLLQPALSQSREYALADAANAFPSAVLVIIHYHQSSNTPRVILTKRSSNLRTHSGEISFPGGRHSKSDPSLLQTALRETQEEIGVKFSEQDVLGSLQAVNTMTSKHFIVPFVTIQEKFAEHKLQTNEVEALIDAPLLDVLENISADTEHYGLAKDAVKFTYLEYTIWGATARILKQLHEVLIRPS